MGGTNKLNGKHEFGTQIIIDKDDAETVNAIKAAAKAALVEKFDFDQNRFAVDGIGWEKPADPEQPDDHAKNRRVEIKGYSAEKE